jgi:hypothetical protein
MSWLGDAVGNPSIPVFDIHNNNDPEQKCIFGGERVAVTPLLGAIVMGFDKYVISLGNSYTAIPNSLGLEYPIVDNAQISCVANGVYRSFHSLSMYAIKSLREKYSDKVSGMSYYRSYVVSSHDENGHLKDAVIELEKIPAQASFKPIDIPATLRQELGWPAEEADELFYYSWAHNHMGHDAPDLGTFEGRPRKAYFGSVFHKIDPPTVDGDWLIFNESHLPSD